MRLFSFFSSSKFSKSIVMLLGRMIKWDGGGLCYTWENSRVDMAFKFGKYDSDSFSQPSTKAFRSRRNWLNLFKVDREDDRFLVVQAGIVNGIIQGANCKSPPHVSPIYVQSLSDKNGLVLATELIFGATAATSGRVKFLNNCVNFSENNTNCFTISPQ